ncbi:MAG: hypothetical protein M0035_05015 [Actinomycetota bacterium]|nr:hypothetical protein [Actinomycetota bacterium]
MRLLRVLRTLVEMNGIGPLDSRPPLHRENRPPGAAALQERAKLMGQAGNEPTVDLEEMAEVVRLAGNEEASA